MSDLGKTTTVLYNCLPLGGRVQKWRSCYDPMRHYLDSRRSNRSGGFLLPRTNTNRYKASFLTSALSVFNENYTSH